MDRQSVKLQFECPSCRVIGTLWYSVVVRASGLGVSSAFHCEQCGHAVETDNDRIDNAIRAVFYEHQGRWQLRLTEAGLSRSATIRKLRDLLGLDLATAGELSRKVPIVIAEGIEVEMSYLKRELDSIGAMTAIVRSEQVDALR